MYDQKRRIWRRVIDTSTSVLVKSRENHLVGFASYSVNKVDEFDIIYLQSGAISNNHQNRGIWHCLLSYRISDAIRKIASQNGEDYTDHILIGGRTQSPLVYRFLHRKLGCFPNPDGTTDPKIKTVARKFAKLLYDHQRCHGNQYEFHFDDETFVTRHAYKKAYSFESKARYMNTGANIFAHKIPFCDDDDEINFYMKEHMNWEDGDVITPLGYYNAEKINQLLPKHQVHLQPA